MIILDIETSGFDKETCGIWQIGAIEFYNSDRTFLEQAHIDIEDVIEPSALKVTGKIEEEIRNPKEQSQKDMLKHFIDWCGQSIYGNFLCQNPQFDLGFIETKSKKYQLENQMHDRAFDLHSIAQSKHIALYRSPLWTADNNSKKISAMSLSKILDFCGIVDKRIQLNKDVIIEGISHNVIGDCRLTGECLSRLWYGQSLFYEFNKFKVPDYLKK